MREDVVKSNISAPGVLAREDTVLLSVLEPLAPFPPQTVTLVCTSHRMQKEGGCIMAQTSDL